MKRLTDIAATLAAMMLTSAASAIDLEWHTVDGGGAVSTGGGFTLAGTAGQADAGYMSGGAFELDGGFWAVASVSGGECAGDADGDNQVNIADLGLVLSNFGQAGPGIAGDLDGDDDVDIADLGLVLANFGAACP